MVKSGKGGAGCVSFRREKFVPKGGPDGGDGGRGGDVILEASERIQTLYDFTHHRRFKAETGQSGGGAQRSGRAGQDLIITTPLGSIITDLDSGEVLADLVEPGQRVVVAQGGQGGKGNKHFATSTHRTPRFAQPGGPAEERRLQIDLKLLADVALIGLPNAGKSTMISRISAARPKTADYPFTTLTPNLGVVEVNELRNFVAADIPGLIEGAAQGAGLGHRFLRHAQRTKLLVYLLDITRRPEEALDILAEELAAYSPELAAKKRIIVLNKIDLLAGQDWPELNLPPGEPVFQVSGLTGQGTVELVEHLALELEKMDRAAEEAGEGSV